MGHGCVCSCLGLKLNNWRCRCAEPLRKAWFTVACVEMTELISHFIHCAQWVHLLFALAAGADSWDRTSFSSSILIWTALEEPSTESKTMLHVSHWQFLLLLKRLQIPFQRSCLLLNSFRPFCGRFCVSWLVWRSLERFCQLRLRHNCILALLAWSVAGWVYVPVSSGRTNLETQDTEAELGETRPGSRSQPVTTHHGVVALPRSSFGKERMVSLMEGGITVFRIRCFLNIFNSLPYPLYSCSLFLWRGLTEVHYRSVSLWLLEEEMGLMVWKADKMQPAKCGSNGSAGIAALSLKWLSLEPSKNVQHSFLHVQWHPAFACKVLCCTPGTQAAQNCL